MIPIALAATISLGVSLLVVYLNERHQLLRIDVFPSPFAKWAAYVWLTLLLVLMSVLVAASSTIAAQRLDPSQLTFWALFQFHLILVVFLAGWWALSGSPPLSRFLNIHSAEGGRAILLGIGVGVGGWAIFIIGAATVVTILNALDLMPTDLEPSPVIPWMAKLPMWQKATLIASAMSVEEAFFRGWLQKRVGLVLSTIVFALAHAGYGQPLMLIGITVISLVIGYTFYKTRNLIPCIVAHGVFDAIQLFVIVPLAIRFAG